MPLKYMIPYVHGMDKGEMTMKRTIKNIAMILALSMLMLALTACGGGDAPAPTATVGTDGTLEGEATKVLNVYLCSSFMSEDAAKALPEQLRSAVPELADSSIAINVNTVMTGDGSDPAMQMASMMKLTGAMAAQEVDVVIADELNAARNARSESFYTLSDLFTADELSALGERGLSYEMVDDEGNPTSERTPVCGVDVTGDELFTPIFGNAQIGAFVIGNAPNLENAKAMVKGLIARIPAAADDGAQVVTDSGDDAAQAELDKASDAAATEAPADGADAADAPADNADATDAPAEDANAEAPDAAA